MNTDDDSIDEDPVNPFQRDPEVTQVELVRRGHVREPMSTGDGCFLVWVLILCLIGSLFFGSASAIALMVITSQSAPSTIVGWISGLSSAAACVYAIVQLMKNE